MMINKRLINTVSDSKKYIGANVAFQMCSLASNIGLIFTVTNLLEKIWQKNVTHSLIAGSVAIIAICIILRLVSTVFASKMSYLSSKAVKKTLRSKIYKKLLKLGPSYKQSAATSEIVQVAVEGVDQLETYFGSYLPQFFYSMLAPLTLFIVLSFVNFPAAVVLLICVPLIPVTIIAVQKFAKKLLSKYWGQYTSLGDTFLENLQGLTTLKIYQADQMKNETMNQESEKFRKITMKVLTMQLNSIIVMDVIAYGGAALGIIMAVTQLHAGHVTFAGCLAIILLSADFFIPMRMLGSFFHIAMNGMAASDKIFHLLDLPEDTQEDPQTFETGKDITFHNLSFSYDDSREILHEINSVFSPKGLTAIVGESGCGKSTTAALLTGKVRGYKGEILIGNTPFDKIPKEELAKNITYIGFDSYLFKGTVRDNLLMGNPDADDKMLWDLLDRVKLSEFLKGENGLDTMLLEKASNLSGGQRQRLALARAILHDSAVYIFDEATSNIDVESEDDILKEIYHLAATKSVILITHRLANATRADLIYVMENGAIRETGTHKELLANNSVYFELWNTQSELENYTKEEAAI